MSTNLVQIQALIFVFDVWFFLLVLVWLNLSQISFYPHKLCENLLLPPIINDLTFQFFHFLHGTDMFHKKHKSIFFFFYKLLFNNFYNFWIDVRGMPENKV